MLKLAVMVPLVAGIAAPLLVEIDSAIPGFKIHAPHHQRGESHRLRVGGNFRFKDHPVNVPVVQEIKVVA